MSVVRRATIGLSILCSSLAACGGGSGGSGAPPMPIPSPTATPLAGTRPTTSGATFVFSGIRVERTTYTYPSPSPNPEFTISSDLTASVTVTSAPDPRGGANVPDFHTVRSEHTAYQTLESTSDDRVAQDSSASPSLFELLDESSTDDQGNAFTSSYTSAPRIVDELPESASQSWSNTAAATIAEHDADGNSMSRTVAADGSYSEEDTLFGGAGTGYPTTYGSYIVKPDGSAIWTIRYDYSGRNLPASSTTYVTTYSAPRDGSITIQLQGYDTPVNPPASPTPTPSPQIVAVAPAWFSGALYHETDVDSGPVAIPAACAVPAAFGTFANEIVRTTTSVDPVLGVIDVAIVTQYVAHGYGPVCIERSETEKAFYDLTRDYESSNSVLFPYAKSALSPLFTTTVTQTMTLQQAGTLPARQAMKQGCCEARFSTATPLDESVMTRNVLQRHLHALKRMLKTLRLRAAPTAVQR